MIAHDGCEAATAMWSGLGCGRTRTSGTDDREKWNRSRTKVDACTVLYDWVLRPIQPNRARQVVGIRTLSLKSGNPDECCSSTRAATGPGRKLRGLFMSQPS